MSSEVSAPIGTCSQIYQDKIKTFAQLLNQFQSRSERMYPGWVVQKTKVTFFIIKGISDVPELQVLIFILVLLIYFITLGGNMTILLLVCLDHHLHTPMYFFLCNLSIMDMCCSTVTLHNILVIFLSGNDSISFSTCMAQMYFFSCFTSNELLILTAMSYDRYVAICNPLHYNKLYLYGKENLRCAYHKVVTAIACAMQYPIRKRSYAQVTKTSLEYPEERENLFLGGGSQHRDGRITQFFKPRHNHQEIISDIHTTPPKRKRIEENPRREDSLRQRY
ncbi:olfactory receptor 5V1-like [Pelobates cultripes]|uniref:Olfactory receptor 5V1-like n=1 Tax=Pelobates cultripes TaxID=61616 RepID=A0AAD1SYW9_PELCU|nr:olfactory receptor 5V1-like [Pelobates cultripes]